MSKTGNWVFSFPVKSPAHALVVEQETTAIEQLEHYLIYATHWAEHNVSVTIYVREHEWLALGAWVYEHFDDINGVLIPAVRRPRLPPGTVSGDLRG